MTENHFESSIFLRSHAELLTGHFLIDLSNTAAYIFSEFRDLNWAGFYLLKNSTLLLGPFQGKPACTHIELGKGVCGSSALKKSIIVVDDVDQFPGHIRCDTGSKSELVVPLVLKDRVIGVLDLDSPSYSRFTKKDGQIFQELLNQLLKAQKKPQEILDFLGFL